jgi:hypothetical protein
LTDIQDEGWDDASTSPAPTSPAQSDAASLIDQLQRLLDAAKASPRDPDDEQPPDRLVAI